MPPVFDFLTRLLFIRLPLAVILVICCLEKVYSYDSLKTATTLHQTSQFEKALPIFIALAKKYKATDDMASYTLCQLKIADIIRNYGGPNSAILLLTENERLLKKQPALYLHLAHNYMAKAEAYYSASNPTEFKLAILKSMAIKKEHALPEKYLAENYLHLARYYKDFHDQDDSVYYWVKKSIKWAKTDKDLHQYILPRIYNLLGYHYHPSTFAGFVNRRDLFFQRLRISRQYYDSALHAVEKQPIADELMVGKIDHNLGNSYNNQYSADENKETMDKAMSYYKKSMVIYERLGSPSDLAMKDWVMGKGKGYERLRLNDSAVLQFQQGLTRLVPGYNQANGGALPSLQPTLNDQRFISLIVIKANNLYFIGRDKKNVSALKSAYEHYSYLLKFHRYLLGRSVNEKDALNWSFLYGSNAYTQLLTCAFELTKLTGENKYIEESFSLLASAKYAWLNRADIEPAVQTSINSSILKEEIKLVKRNILKKIPALTEEQLNSILPPIDSKIVTPALSNFNLAKQVLDSVSLKSLQQQLGKENSVLIDYYLNNQVLYSLIITKNSFDCIKQIVPKDFLPGVSKLQKKSNTLSPKEYAKLSNFIYREALDSVLMKIPVDSKRLIICPDYLMLNIAWDALATDTINSTSFKGLPYLLKRFTIRTILSPRHLITKKESRKNQFYGIAPSFIKSNRFSAIPFSTLLVKLKSKEYKGNINANLTQTALDTEILHIAAHVVNDSVRAYNSSLYFSDADSLTISQLTQSLINPRLVILNGCQTAAGKFYGSEGTMSFCRSFYRIGAESVLMTLWNVDDKTSADILAGFYKEIDRGNSLDVALSRAKTNFLNTAAIDELANPYYWAGLQISGKAEAIHSKENYWIFVSIAMASALFIAVFFWLRRKDWLAALPN